MTTLEVSNDVAEKIQQEASTKGLSVDDYLRSLLLAPEPKKLTPEERARRWRELAKRQHSDAPPLSDKAISRQSIYTREDEML